MKETAESSGGINLEAHMVLSDDNLDDEIANWMVENVKFSVKQPVMKFDFSQVFLSLPIILLGGFCIIIIVMLYIEAVVTKDELQHLVLLCKSEVDSMGRITAGLLQLLTLERSIGQAAIDQLSNLVKRHTSILHLFGILYYNFPAFIFFVGCKYSLILHGP